MRRPAHQFSARSRSSSGSSWNQGKASRDARSGSRGETNGQLANGARTLACRVRTLQKLWGADALVRVGPPGPAFPPETSSHRSSPLARRARGHRTSPPLVCRQDRPAQAPVAGSMRQIGKSVSRRIISLCAPFCSRSRQFSALPVRHSLSPHLKSPRSNPSTRRTVSWTQGLESIPEAGLSFTRSH